MAGCRVIAAHAGFGRRYRFHQLRHSFETDFCPAPSSSRNGSLVTTRSRPRPSLRTPQLRREVARGGRVDRNHGFLDLSGSDALSPSPLPIQHYDCSSPAEI